MKKSVIKSAKTINEAIKLALIELNTDQENVEIDIIERPSSGFLGLIGVKPAIIKVTTIINEETSNTVVQRSVKPVVEEKKQAPKKQPSKPHSTKATNEVKKVSEAKPKQERPARTPATKAQEQEIASFVQQLCNNISEGSIATLESSEDDVINISISGDNIGLIVGKHGETLNAIQYLTSLVYSKQRDGYHRVSIDAGGYREKRKEKIIEFSKRMADKARRTGRRISLEPMNSYERRIIHMALQEVEGINTFSEGDDPNRRVVIVAAGGDKNSRYNRRPNNRNNNKTSNSNKSNSTSSNNRKNNSSNNNSSNNNSSNNNNTNTDAQRRAREERNYTSTEKKRSQLEHQESTAAKPSKPSRPAKAAKPQPKKSVAQAKPESNPYEHYYSKYDNRVKKK